MVRSVVKKSMSTDNTEYFSVIEEPDCQYCGCIDLQHHSDDDSYEVGITLLKSSQNRGIGYTALKQFFDYCHSEKGLNQLVAMIEPANTRSIRLFERLGAVQTGKEPLKIVADLYKSSGMVMPDEEKELFCVLKYSIELR